MDHIWILRQLWLTILIIFVSIDQINGKRGGVSIGRGASRSRGGGGGLFGGYKGNSGQGWGQGRTNMGTNTGGHTFHGGKTHSGSRTGSSGTHSGGFSSGSSSGFGRTGGKMKSKGGLGSVMRSNTFKNAIVGAAAGYLTYQAGKAIIRNAMTPMMWNNRPYYWGSNYYNSRPGQSMCRMPVESSDPQFGNVYFQDNSRPREIVWGCGYNEYCCGYECCRTNGGGGFGSYGHYGGFGLGSLIILAITICLSCYLVKKYCLSRAGTQYMPGRAV